MTIPFLCLNSLKISLKFCLTNNIAKITRSLYLEYQLFASTSGSNLLSFLKDNNKRMIQHLDQVHAFDMFTDYRNMYFADLFTFLRKFAAKYRIKDMNSINILENKLGALFEQIKTQSHLSSINFSIIDSLDKYMYDCILQVKAQFNNFTPIRGNSEIIRAITQTFMRCMDKFREINIKKYNIISEKIQNRIKAEILIWSRSFNENKSMDFFSGEKPLSIFMPKPAPHSYIVKNYIHEPTSIEYKAHPTYVPA